MSSLREKINHDLKASLKEGKKEEVAVLRLLLNAIVKQEKEKRYRLFKQQNLNKEVSLTDEEIITVIWQELKKREEAIAEFRKAGRDDLVEKEKTELIILKRYLPALLSEEEIRKKAKNVIEELGIKDIRGMGRVMAKLMPEIKGRARGEEVKRIVKELLLKK